MKKMFLGVFVVLLVAVSFAYTAANTVPVTGAGDGSATISGYTVDNVEYELFDGDPGQITAVKFTLSPEVTSAPAPTTVKIKLQSSETASWYNCTFEDSSWNCPVTGGVQVSAADNLRVVAAQ
jgi:predicted small secreted protein